MVFWGLEVKPGQSVPFDTESFPGRLHITQATLGNGNSSKKSVLQCVVGDNSPIFLCSLLPDKIENCQLNLEFDEDDVVSFSTIGPRSIHLSGFIETDGQDMDDDGYEFDSYGEDISESDSEAFSDDNSDDMSDDEFSDEDVLMYPPPVSNSGVVIEEIVDEEKPAAAPGKNRSNDSKKKGQPIGNGDNDASQKQIVVKHSSSVPASESEDEDGFPVPESTKSKAQKQESKAGKTVKSKSKDSKKKRSRDEISTKTEDTSTDQQIREEKKTSDLALSAAGATENNEQPKKKKKSAGKESKKAEDDEKTTAVDDKLKSVSEITPVTDGDQSSEKKTRKNKKKKNKTQKAEEKADLSEKLTEKETEAKATQVREFPNGLVIEELKMGRPDGKRASPGKQVSVVYIGKLKKNGSTFDSNVGRAPFKFRLGVGQVIKGWDVGVNGMRVGDKRRLTIPPAMGYGAQGAGHKIPPNSWLLFDVELVNVS